MSVGGDGGGGSARFCARCDLELGKRRGGRGRRGGREEEEGERKSKECPGCFAVCCEACVGFVVVLDDKGKIVCVQDAAVRREEKEREAKRKEREREGGRKNEGSQGQEGVFGSVLSSLNPFGEVAPPPSSPSPSPSPSSSRGEGEEEREVEVEVCSSCKELVEHYLKKLEREKMKKEASSLPVVKYYRILQDVQSDIVVCSFFFFFSSYFVQCG